MTVEQRYESAKEQYRAIGVDTDAAIEKLKNVAISMHCWQGDDVTGFDHDGPLSGGIQATGKYPGKARTPKELMDDMDQALSLIPGKHKINLHASYAILRMANSQTAMHWNRGIFANGSSMQKKETWESILTRRFSPMKRQQSLRYPARTKKFVSFGFDMGRHVSAFPSILQKNWGSPV